MLDWAPSDRRQTSETSSMFTFFGLFADPVSGLSEQAVRAWPDMDMVRIDRPIQAIAIRFHADSYDRERDEIPKPVVRAVESLSRAFPDARFLLLRTECYDGQCTNWGRIIRNGEVVLDADRDGALRRLILHWGVDIGPLEIFDPLSREFPWGSPRRRPSTAQSKPSQ